MRQLPRIKITYGNGALAQAISSADGLMCLVVIGVDEPEGNGEFLGIPHPLNRLSDLENLRITEENNPFAYGVVKDFYTEAPEGTKVYLSCWPEGTPMSTLLDKDSIYLPMMLKYVNGEVRGLFVTAKPAEEFEIADGLDEDIKQAVINAQLLGDMMAETHFAPIFTILDGLSYTGNPEDLADLTKDTKNRVGILIGSKDAESENQSVGLLAGRLASIPVHRHPGRVLDGPLNVLNMYAGSGNPIELMDIETINGKGYITFTTYTGVSGYFFADDPLATKETDDYNTITRRRVIDKAYRIAYATVVEQLKDEIPVNADGTMMETYAKAFELKVENAIAGSMTANGELSSDPADSSDRGVQFVIDRTNNVLSTNKVLSNLRVRPHGYGKYIDVELGFTVTQS